MPIWANAEWTEKLKPNPIMKTKLELRTAAATLMLIASMVAAPAQPIPKNAPVVNPATGLPAPGGVPTIDPNTGLPLPPPEPQWIDTSWSDPDIVLTNVFYDGLPLSEVPRNLRERFKDHFDILPMPQAFGHDWGSEITIQLQLKNVKASEVFNAMNLVFENDRTPLRWELKMNGNRPTALLRVLREAAPEPPAATQPEVRRVFFVGDLFDERKKDADQMHKLANSIEDIWLQSGVSTNANGHLRVYMPGQLIIVNGSPDLIELTQQTLQALKQKAERERLAHGTAPAPESEGPKSSGDGGSK